MTFWLELRLCFIWHGQPILSVLKLYLTYEVNITKIWTLVFPFPQKLEVRLALSYSNNCGSKTMKANDWERHSMACRQPSVQWVKIFGNQIIWNKKYFMCQCLCETQCRGCSKVIYWGAISCWRKGDPFFLNMWSLVDFTCSIVWPCTQAFVDGAN